MSHVTISGPDVYWKVPSENWWAYVELNHKNPGTLKGSDEVLDQSCDLPQAWGSVHFCKLCHNKSSGGLWTLGEIFSSLQRNCPLLLFNFPNANIKAFSVCFNITVIHLRHFNLFVAGEGWAVTKHVCSIANGIGPIENIVTYNSLFKVEFIFNKYRHIKN